MSFLDQVFHWFTTAGRWTGAGGILVRLGHQLELSAAVVVASAVIGVGVGLILGHTGRGSFLAINVANACRAIPSLALLTLLAIQPSIGLQASGLLAAFLALAPLRM